MIAVVTGTGSGIGAAIAARLRAAGWTVAAGTLEDASLDVRSDDSVREFVEAALAREGRIDALVNNAGVALGGAVEEATIDEARALFETNFFGMARMVRAVLPHFRARREGRIVNVSSGAGFTAEPFAGYYSASKFAMEGYTEALRHEVRALGIRVSLVQPGWFRTPIVRNARIAAEIADYREARRRVTEKATRYCDEAPGPDRVAKVVERVLRARSPRLRYRVGADVTMSFWSRRFLPEGLYQSMVAGYYGVVE